MEQLLTCTLPETEHDKFVGRHEGSMFVKSRSTHMTTGVSPLLTNINEKYPQTMSSRGPHNEGSTEEKRLASLSDILPFLSIAETYCRL